MLAKSSSAAIGAKQSGVDLSDGQAVEQAIVAQDLNGRSIHNTTIGPAGWLGETPENRAKVEKDLRPVDRILLEKALPYFHVITGDYAKAPLADVFNWDEVAGRLGPETEGDWFIVAFRSVRRADANHQLLFEADAQAQQEAIQSGGLLKVNIHTYMHTHIHHTYTTYKIFVCLQVTHTFFFSTGTVT